MLVIFSEDGVFTMVNIAKGRSKIPKPVGDLTVEELRSRFTGVQAVYGTYTVGNRLTRNVVGAVNPNNEGQQIFRSVQDRRRYVSWMGPCNQGRKPTQADQKRNVVGTVTAEAAASGTRGDTR